MLRQLITRVSKVAPIESVLQAGRFLLVGILSAALEMGLLIILVEYASFPYLQANMVAFVITNVFNYLLSRHWVFVSGNSKRVSEFMFFMFFVLIGLLINQFFLWLFVEASNFDYRIAKLLAIGITVAWNFLTRKHFVFKTYKKQSL